MKKRRERRSRELMRGGKAGFKMSVKNKERRSERKEGRMGKEGKDEEKE